jgi:hypothetical protein
MKCIWEGDLRVTWDAIQLRRIIDNLEYWILRHFRPWVSNCLARWELVHDMVETEEDGSRPASDDEDESRENSQLTDSDGSVTASNIASEDNSEGDEESEESTEGESTSGYRTPPPPPPPDDGFVSSRTRTRMVNRIVTPVPTITLSGRADKRNKINALGDSPSLRKSFHSAEMPYRSRHLPNDAEMSPSLRAGNLRAKHNRSHSSA